MDLRLPLYRPRLGMASTQIVAQISDRAVEVAIKYPSLIRTP